MATWIKVSPPRARMPLPAKAAEAYKRDKSIHPSFRPEGAIVYDPRVMSFKNLNQVSLLTLSGRVLVPFRIGGYQASRMGAIKGQKAKANGTLLRLKI